MRDAKIIAVEQEDQFKITINFEWVASLKEIFADEIPKNPTVRSVIKEIEKYSSIVDFIKDWNLDYQDPNNKDNGQFVITVSKVS